ncbi:MAG TPA: hypothetical protein VM677_06400, partial [Actinokineospora sp.]|nr:hypothetical protein [Actinokineospora sp.]
MTAPVRDLLEPMIQPAATAQRHLATDDGAIDRIGGAHATVSATLDNTTYSGQQSATQLREGWTGQGSARHQADVSGQSQAGADLSQYSVGVQQAVREASDILKVGQKVNQDQIDDFNRKAAELLQTAAALRQAGDPAGAQQKLTELARYAAQLTGDTSMNLDAVMTQLSGVVTKLTGGSQSTTPSGANSPTAYNN